MQAKKKGGIFIQEKKPYRHELKYEIGYATYLALRQRLRTVMKPDIHTDANGCYQIRSIYFDNFEDKALREKINGIQKREKFRIRYYNDNFSFLTLEQKIKYNELCLKYSTPISEKECRSLLDGNLHFLMEHPSDLVRKLSYKMKTEQLRPRVLVSYLREPYVYAAGNVRVTFDSHIRTSLYHRSFLEATVPDISAQDEPGAMILEIKYDAFLPEIISCLLQTEGIRKESFSKYGACRRFG